jgi:hypothetical protein
MVSKHKLMSPLPIAFCLVMMIDTKVEMPDVRL